MIPTIPADKLHSRPPSAEAQYYSDQQIAELGVIKIHYFLSTYFHIRFQAAIATLAPKPNTQLTYLFAIDLIEKHPNIFPISTNDSAPFERKLVRIRKDTWDTIYFAAELRISQTAYNALLRHSKRF